MKKPYVVSAWVDIDVRSNLKNHHYVSGPLRHLMVIGEYKHGKQQLAAGNLNITASVNGAKTAAHVNRKVRLCQPKRFRTNKQTLPSVYRSQYCFPLRTAPKHYTVEGYLGNLKIDEHREGNTVSLFNGDLNIHTTMAGNLVNGGC